MSLSVQKHLLYSLLDSCGCLLSCSKLVKSLEDYMPGMANLFGELWPSQQSLATVQGSETKYSDNREWSIATQETHV